MSPLAAALVLLALAGLLFVVLRWLNRRHRGRPVERAFPASGTYLVCWDSIFGGRELYRGPDWVRAKKLYTEAGAAEGIPRGAVIEFWDGPHNRGRRHAYHDA